MTAFPPTIPTFDQWGNLEIGRRDAGGAVEGLLMTSLTELQTRFVTEVRDSTTRPEIWDGWMRHRAALAAINLRPIALVNGSFTTNKRNPKDIDLCYLVDAEAVNNLTAAERTEYTRLFDADHCQQGFRCDPFAIRCYPPTHMRFASMINEVAYWTRVFGVDRKGHPKRILMISGGDTL